MRISLTKWQKYLAITLLLAWGAVEVLCYLAIHYTPVGAVYFYRPVAADRSVYAEYAKVRHPLLGWDSATLSRDGLDDIGARVTPAFPAPRAQAPLISVYGDSWTFSDGVDAEHSYANVLSKLVGRRVNNFGVDGYGTAQAYLRFKTQTEDSARIVVLGHLSQNILRNVNQFYDLLAQVSAFPFTFKPRFLVDGHGRLELVPLPTACFSPEQYADCVRNPEKYLMHDFFVPGGPAGVQKPGFPNLLSVLRIRHHFRFQASIRDDVAWSAFYRPDHPSRGLEVTTAIIRAFFRDAQTMGKTPVLALFGEQSDIERFQKGKGWAYQPLLDNLRLLGIPYVNVSAFLLDKVPSDQVSTLFLSDDGHPSIEGCRLQALAVYQHLVDRGLVKHDDRGARPTSTGRNGSGTSCPATQRGP